MRWSKEVKVDGAKNVEGLDTWEKVELPNAVRSGNFLCIDNVFLAVNTASSGSKTIFRSADG